MLEIDKYIMDVIKASTYISNLTGAVFGDYRIYTWEPPFDVIFSTTKKAAIFYKERHFGSPKEFSFPSQKGNIQYIIQVVSPTKVITKQIVEELDKIFCSEMYSGFVTDNWKIGVVKNDGVVEFQIESKESTKPLYIRTIYLLLKEVFYRQNFYSSP